MESEDYEALPTSNVTTHMMAGAIAGIMEHSIMFPVDSVKTRMQSLSPSPEAQYSSVRDGLRKMVNGEGVMRTLRGVNAVILGAGPAHALYFSAYEGIKAKLKSQNAVYNNLANAAAGCGATILHDAVMVPSEALKQRMQMHNSPYKTCIDCMLKLYYAEGAKVFYRSFSTQIFMNIPFHATHIMIYEQCSEMLNPKREHKPMVHMFAGAMGGAIAAACTTPFDVCKTLLNTQESSSLKHMKAQRIVGIVNAIKTIYQLRGWRGYFRGIQARVIFQVPSTAISWTVYELFKHKLLEVGSEDSSDKSISVDNLSGVTPNSDTGPHNFQFTERLVPSIMPSP